MRIEWSVFITFGLTIGQIFLCAQDEFHAANRTSETDREVQATLEFPDEQEGKLHPQGVVTIARPQDLRRVYIHLPDATVMRVFSFINTKALGTYSSLRKRWDNVKCELVLEGTGRGRAFEPGINTLEVKAELPGENNYLYASWVIMSPEETQDWEQVISLETHGRKRAQEVGYQEISVLTKAGSRHKELWLGRTESDEILVRARFLGVPEGCRLQTRHLTNEKENLYSAKYTVPEQKAQPSGSQQYLQNSLTLAEGKNKLEVTLWHEDVAIERKTYRISRETSRKPEVFDGEKWALIIGISDYKHDGIKDLSFADRDGIAIEKFLTGEKGGGFKPFRIKRFINHEATLTNINKALSKFLAKSQPQDLVFIFWAGHGLADPENLQDYFLLTHDTKPNELAKTALSMNEFKRALTNQISAERMVVLADTCHSGVLAETSGTRGVGRLNYFNQGLNKALTGEKGRLVITASRPHEQSLEDIKWGDGHGIFTYSVLRGFGGDADLNRDQIVTAEELMLFIKYFVPLETMGRQNPFFGGENFNPEFPLAMVRPD